MIQNLPALEDAVIHAGQLIMAYYKTDRDRGIEIKGDNSPVTLADTASDQYLRDALYQIEPLPILSEETQDDGLRLSQNRLWLIDPLDGTKDFIAQTDDFAINIAIIENRRPVFGMIYLPVPQVLYYAQAGQGAFKKDLCASSSAKRLHTSDRSHQLILLKSRFSLSREHDALVESHKDRVQEVRIVGSCIKGCHVAEGLAQGYYRFGLTSEWDTAPMDLLVHEAGGYLRQMDGSEMTYNRQDVINRMGFYVVSGPLGDLK